MRNKVEVLQWLNWKMGGLGPMLGQNGHFKFYAPDPIPYAQERYHTETLRLYGVLDRRLEDREYICTDYSIADMACFPWVRINKLCGQRIEAFPNVARWYGEIRSRPAVGRGIEILKDRYVEIADSAEARQQLFGQSAG